jgi:hypothetical protein
MRSTLMAAVILSVVAIFIPQASKAGAPLKGVDVKLGKNPGGSPAARTTNDSGSFDFGVLPKGSYYLIIASHSTDKNAPATCDVEINGAEGGTVKAEWDLKNGRVLNTGGGTARSSGDRIILNSDGSHPLNGVVKSKSNIANN